MLYTPEEDLPARFKPSTSSESFVTASKAGAGGDALALGWAVDKLSKQAGFPRKTVQAAFKRIVAAERSQGVELPRTVKEGLALEMLLRQTAGWDSHEETEEQWTSSAILSAALSYPPMSTMRISKRSTPNAPTSAWPSKQCWAKIE